MPSGGPGGHYETRDTASGLVAVHWVSDRGGRLRTDMRPIVTLGEARVPLMRDALDRWLAEHDIAAEPDDGDGGEVVSLRVVT